PRHPRHGLAHGQRQGLDGERLGSDHHRTLCQRVRRHGRRLVPEFPRPALAQPGDHQPAADPDLGRRSPVVLPYRVCQGQPLERARHERRAVRRPGDARRPDGPGVLQRHPATGAMTPHARPPDPPPHPHATPDRTPLMTRFPNRRLLAIALASTLAAPAWAQQPVDPQAAFGVAPQPAAAPLPGAFTVSDIRVDGLQRIGAGTVFTYLPIERGDTVDASRIGDAIRALYATGFFEDVSAGRQGDILVVQVKERPAINKLTLTGNKDIKTEDLTKGLTDIGLAEGETFDRLALDRVTQELTRQYNNRGKYN